MALKPTRTLVSFDWAMKSILRDKANFDVLKMSIEERRAYEEFLVARAAQDDILLTDGR